MKKYFLFMAVALTGLSFTACSDDDDTTPNPGKTEQYYVDASSNTNWNYIRLSDGELVGTGENTEASNAEWFARTNWDIAINRYYIRTNSGTSSTTGANGGVYTYGSFVSFASVATVPAGITFAADEIHTDAGMGGDIIRSRSDAQVVTLMKNPDGSTIMPPQYERTPVHIFRTADGSSFYKVEFTQYKNNDDVAGHINFDVARIYQ